MRSAVAIVAVSGALAAFNVSIAAKGDTTRITIAGGDLASPVAITDRAVLERFTVWSGVGTGGTVNGVAWQSTDGFIIDWRRGVVSARPSGLPQYEVAFDTNIPNRFDDGPTYIVLYENDRAAGEGYVYLPGRNDPQYRRNVRAILRNVEGGWFHASRAWQDAAQPLLTASARAQR